MTRVTCIGRDGAAHDIDVTPGVSLMKAAVGAGIAGIDATCGGACACGTCHVYVDDAWRGKVTPMSLAEQDLLAVLRTTRPNSRLSCQIVIGARVDGLIVRVANDDQAGDST